MQRVIWQQSFNESIGKAAVMLLFGAFGQALKALCTLGVHAKAPPPVLKASSFLASASQIVVGALFTGSFVLLIASAIPARQIFMAEAQERRRANAARRSQQRAAAPSDHTTF